jgi:calcineurin-like phosphoesterase family protein
MKKFVNRFVISDTHFGHTNSWEKFKLADGSPLRPFSSTEEMDETMIDRWNAKVKPGDTVYHLGDVVIKKSSLKLVSRLNGRKILIRGNHDIFKDDEYRDVGFEQLLGVRVFVDQFILSHIPLHPECVTDRFKVNVHGHLHANEIMHMQQPDSRYLCVSVEHTNYEPLHFDEVEARIQKRWQDTGYTNPVRAWGNDSGPG